MRRLSSGKESWVLLKVSIRPESVAKALKSCEYEMYPNLSVTIKNDGTLAVT